LPYADAFTLIMLMPLLLIFTPLLMPPLLLMIRYFISLAPFDFDIFDASHYFTLLIFAISPLHC
jgi:hypothetical protein